MLIGKKVHYRDTEYSPKDDKIVEIYCTGIIRDYLTDRIFVERLYPTEGHQYSKYRAFVYPNNKINEFEIEIIEES